MKLLIKMIIIVILILALQIEVSSEPVTPTVSMDFKDASLKDVLKTFSQLSGINFIAGEEVEDRKITLYLDKVTVEDALNQILKANNLTYEQPPGSNIIIVKEVVVPEVETITRIYQLNYAKAESVRELFEKMREKKREGAKEEKVAIRTAGLLSEYGKIVADVRTNSIIVTDIPTQFPIIEEAIAKLDEQTPQVMIEAELLETSVGTLEKLGVEWADTIAVYTGPKTTTKFPLRKKDLSSADKTSGLAYATLSMQGLAATLRALTTQTDTRTLARPRILTLNNETAEINITAQTAVASITAIQAIEGVGLQTTYAERIQTGIVLKVTPQINKDGFITMLIEPSVTTPKRSEFFTEAEYVDPHTRAVKTTVRVKDGETVVIGGLISGESEKIEKKVPLLGDIPIIGNVFKHKSTDKEDKELIVFITPHIFRDYLAPSLLEELEREITPPQATSKEKIVDQLLEEFNNK